MGMELRTAPGRFLINDPVGAQDTEPDTAPVYGRVEIIGRSGIFIKVTGVGTMGPFSPGMVWHDATAHVDYPHHPGTLYDCSGCEAIMDKDDHGDYVESDATEQGI